MSRTSTVNSFDVDLEDDPVAADPWMDKWASAQRSADDLVRH
jgi:hypothetical protein